MSWNVSEKEYKSVVLLSGAKRYSYFVKKVADCGEVWSLRNKDGWVLAEDESGLQVIPVWPHERYAQACITQEWQDCITEVIDLKAWMHRWIPGMIKDGRRVAVFSTTDDKGIVVEPVRLQNDLNNECEQYHGGDFGGRQGNNNSGVGPK